LYFPAHSLFSDLPNLHLLQASGVSQLNDDEIDALIESLQEQLDAVDVNPVPASQLTSGDGNHVEEFSSAVDPVDRPIPSSPVEDCFSSHLCLEDLRHDTLIWNL
jgi:hypothetical protein